MQLAFIGYGEVARHYAEGLLEAGWPKGSVFAYYPAGRGRAAVVRSQAEAAGVGLVGEPSALRIADMVLSAVHPATALDVAEAVLPHLAAGTVYADINSTSAALKRQIAAMAVARGVIFADVALCAAAPIFKHRARMLVSGPGAQTFRTALEPFGGNVHVMDAEAGAAAHFKMLRSTASKGMAMLLSETMVAARAAGVESEMMDDLVQTIGAMPFERLMERWMVGSAEHAARRVGEMEFVLDTLSEVGVRPQMTTATRDAMARLARAGSVKAANWREALDYLAQVWSWDDATGLGEAGE